ncbi:MAG: hypothetical protein Kow009_05600 [Spirochaetales bacterium]
MEVSLHEKSLTVQSLEHGMSILGGIYTWKFEVEGELLHFEARFTFVLDGSKAHPILHHHSSQVPRMV